LKFGASGIAVLLVGAAVLSCRAPLPARPAGKTIAPPPQDTFVVREVVMPDREPLQMACTPSGPEICFDATDNNCNGVIDEGCGVETGPLQFTIAWPEGADVDIDVTDPNMEKPNPEGRTEAGLAKGKDCGRPQSVCHGQNLENVYFAGDRPPPGHYKVEIKVAKPEDARFPVKVRFGGRIGVKTFSRDLRLDSPEATEVMEFVVQ
jgi:tRNA (guanosine-2'-O-)-methyltransferase